MTWATQAAVVKYKTETKIPPLLPSPHQQFSTCGSEREKIHNEGKPVADIQRDLEMQLAKALSHLLGLNSPCKGSNLH